MVAQGTFRLDLYYRLNVVDLHIPPLRERKADIPLLAAHFLKQFNHTYKTQRVLAPDTLNLLLQYQWPGNVRELCHTIESLVALADGNVILPSMLPPEISGFYAQTYHTSPVSPNASMSLKEAVANLETQMIQHALSTHHTLTSAAASLQLDTSTLIKKKKKYGL
jgi:transcriptional regulator with PAS, ATPase and Fis domain